MNQENIREGTKTKMHNLSEFFNSIIFGNIITKSTFVKHKNNKNHEENGKKKKKINGKLLKSFIFFKHITNNLRMLHMLISLI